MSVSMSAIATRHPRRPARGRRPARSRSPPPVMTAVLRSNLTAALSLAYGRAGIRSAARGEQSGIRAQSSRHGNPDGSRSRNGHRSAGRCRRARGEALDIEQAIVDVFQCLMHAAVLFIDHPRPDGITAGPQVDPAALLPLPQPRDRTGSEVRREVSRIQPPQRGPERQQRRPGARSRRRTAAASPRR